MTSYFNACDVTVADSNRKIFLLFFDVHLCPPTLNKVPPTMDIECQKLISHSLTRWLSLYSSFPRMLQMYPASHSYFMSIDNLTVVLKRLLWKFSERTLFKTLTQSFLVAFNEQVGNTGKSKASFVELVSCFGTVKVRIQ